MKRMMTMLAVAAMSVAAFADEVAEEEVAGMTVCQLGLFTPVQLPCGYRDVKGLEWNLIYGRAHDVAGVDLGLVNYTARNCRGFQCGLADYVESDACGVQLAALGNFAGRNLYGVQMSAFVNACRDEAGAAQLALVNKATHFSGAQLGLVNMAGDDRFAVQLGAVNFVDQKIGGCQLGVFNLTDGLAGAQIGLVNSATEASSGLQLGIFNSARHHTGVQIGLINLNEQGYLNIMPIANVNF